jgi:hypothetical protein
MKLLDHSTLTWGITDRGTAQSSIRTSNHWAQLGNRGWSWGGVLP